MAGNAHPIPSCPSKQLAPGHEVAMALYRKGTQTTLVLSIGNQVGSLGGEVWLAFPRRSCCEKQQKLRQSESSGTAKPLNSWSLPWDPLQDLLCSRAAVCITAHRTDAGTCVGHRCHLSHFRYRPPTSQPAEGHRAAECVWPSRAGPQQQSWFHQTQWGPKCWGKVCRALGGSLGQTHTQRDKLSGEGALKRKLKIVLTF